MTAGCPGKVGWSLPSVGWCYAAASMEAIYMASLKGFAMSPSSLPPTGPYIMRCLYSRTLESRDFSMLHALSVQKKFVHCTRTLMPFACIRTVCSLPVQLCTWWCMRSLLLCATCMLQPLGWLMVSMMLRLRLRSSHSLSLSLSLDLSLLSLLVTHSLC